MPSWTLLYCRSSARGSSAEKYPTNSPCWPSCLHKDHMTRSAALASPWCTMIMPSRSHASVLTLAYTRWMCTSLSCQGLEGCMSVTPRHIYQVTTINMHSKCNAYVQAETEAASNIIGRKSETIDREANQSKSRQKRARNDDNAGLNSRPERGVMRFSKSASVFGMLQDRRSNSSEKGPEVEGRAGKRSAAWKL